MRLKTIGLPCIAVLIAAISTPIALSFPGSPGTLRVLAQTPESLKIEGYRLFKQGLQQFQTSQFEAALRSWQEALKIYRQIKDRQGEGWVLGGLGIAYLSLGDYPKAIGYSQQWLAIAREIKDRESEGKALGNLGVAYRNLGDYPKSIDYFQKSLAIAREIKDRNSEGKALGHLGVAYRNLGDYPKSIDYFQKSLAIAREIKDRQSEGGALDNLGLAYLYLGDYPKAIDYLQQSLAIAREIKYRESEGSVLGSLGLAYLYLGDYPKSIDYFQKSLAIAREIKDRKSEGNALGNLGLAYLYLGDYPKSIDYFQKSLAIAREIKSRESESTALNNIGFIFYKQANFTQAESHLISAIQVKESLRVGLKDQEKISIIDTQSNTYKTLQQVLIAQNKTDAALLISERARARAFVSLLQAKLSANSKQQLSFAPPTLENLKQIAKTQNATLVQYSIVGDDFKIESKQKNLESELYIWIVKPTGEVSFRKVDLKPLWQKENTAIADLVTTTRESIGVRGRGLEISARPQVQAKRFSKLHKLLIEPIADLLPKNPDESVIFVPQDELFLVPFAALQDDSGKYLIEKHTILTAPSIQVLDLTHKQRLNVSKNKAKEILVIGNPTMPKVSPKIGEPPQQLANLPGALQEALHVANLLKTKAIVGKDATKAALKQRLPQARIVHLATHGLLDDFKNTGYPGAIALAPTPTDDGLLTSYEIMDLKLNAELVVLSACDTGRGKLSGDGVIGLSRSLISAGTPSVIVSLWSVPDSPTASLMTEFYKNLQTTPNKAKALRQAMLKTKEKHPNPRDWAAFTLIGEAE